MLIKELNKTTDKEEKSNCGINKQYKYVDSL